MDDDARRELERTAFGATRTPAERRAAEEAARELARADARERPAAASRRQGAGGPAEVRRSRVAPSIMHPVPPRPTRPLWRRPGLVVGAVVVVLCGLVAGGLTLASAVLQDRPNAFLGAHGLTAREVRELGIPAFDVFDRPATPRELRYLDELEVGGRVVQLGPRILDADDEWDYAAVIIRSLVSTIEPQACVWALGERGSTLACTDLSEFADRGVEGETRGGRDAIAFRWGADGSFDAARAR